MKVHVMVGQKHCAETEAATFVLSHREAVGMSRKYSRVLMMVCMAVGLLACRPQANQPQEVPFTVAEGYFFKNHQPCPSEVLVMNSRQALEEHLGYATTMQTRPTAVDFDKQAVLALVLPETDRATELTVCGITAVASDSLVVTYQVKTGEKQSYTIQPMKVLLVDKSLVQGAVVAVAE